MTAQVGRRYEPRVLTGGGRGEPLIARKVLIESFRACERAALADLVAVAGGRSLCSPSRHGTVKYHEGTAAALSEARRALEALPDAPDGAQAARAALRDVRAGWRTQSRTRALTGPDWTGYLTGGLDSLEQMIDEDGLPPSRSQP